MYELFEACVYDFNKIDIITAIKILSYYFKTRKTLMHNIESDAKL